MTPMKPSIYDLVALSGLVLLLAAATATQSAFGVDAHESKTA